jgi:hypothetical protein
MKGDSPVAAFEMTGLMSSRNFNVGSDSRIVVARFRFS